MGLLSKYLYVLTTGLTGLIMVSKHKIIIGEWCLGLVVKPLGCINWVKDCWDRLELTWLLLCWRWCVYKAWYLMKEYERYSTTRYYKYSEYWWRKKSPTRWLRQRRSVGAIKKETLGVKHYSIWSRQTI